MLCLEPGFVVFILHEGLTFAAHQFDTAPAAVIVGETDEVFFSIMTLGCCWSPHIGMNFFTNAGCVLAHALHWYRFAHRLCLRTSITEGSLTVHSAHLD